MLKKLFKGIKLLNLLGLTIAGIVNAFGVTVFLAPVQLYDSGISGTAMLLSQITPESLTLSLFLVILNIPLFLFGWKRQGTLFTVYAVYTVVIYSVQHMADNRCFADRCEYCFAFGGEDLLLCALFGGLISGVGSGLAIRFGGVMDGIEVMSVIFAKRIGISVGTFVMVYNVLLYIVCGIVIKDWILPLYSIVTYTAALKTVDYIVEGFDHSKAATIITECPDQVCNALTEAFECGVTRISARGGYSNTEKTMVYFVVNRFQIARMKDIVHQMDPTAYITISEVADVFYANKE